VDLLSLSGHKIGGPKGTGLLWVRRGVLLQPLLTGDDRERGRRAGMEDLPAIMGLAHALEIAIPVWEARTSQVERLASRLVDGVRKLVPDTVLTGHATDRLPYIASFCIPQVDGEALLQQLDIQGIAAASGSACTSATLEPSHVLKAMGISTSLAEGNLRLSLGIENTDADVDHLLAVLPGMVHRMRSLRA
jgi:cysteine desulfurase